MIAKPWVSQYQKNLICVDSYHNGVPVGRILSTGLESENFESLSQFLIKMEELLDDRQTPQSYTATRSFNTFVEPLGSQAASHTRRGAKATFEVQVIFRQHTSWQGVVYWQEAKQEQSFRSVLELILLMDSALRSVEGADFL